MNPRDDEMDDTEMWRDIRARGQAVRANNREASAALLKDKGVSFESRNYGAHLIVHHGSRQVDFWPGTGRWIDRKDRKVDRRGVFKLLQYLGVSTQAKP